MIQRPPLSTLFPYTTLFRSLVARPNRLLVVLGVGVRAEPRDDLALRGTLRERAADVPAIGAVALAKQAELPFVDRAAFDGVPPALNTLRSVVRVHYREPPLATRDVEVEPRVLREATIRVLQVALGPGGPHHLRNRFGEIRIAAFRGELELGDLELAFASLGLA